MIRATSLYAYPLDNGQLVHKVLARSLADCGARLPREIYRVCPEQPRAELYCQRCYRANRRIGAAGKAEL